MSKETTMKITHVVGFPLDFNGNLTRILGEATCVAKLGYEVEVLVSENVPKKNLSRAIQNGVKFRYLKPMIPSGGLGWRLNNTVPLSIGAIRSVLADGRGLLFHVAAPSPVTKPLTVTEISKRFKKPRILDLHDPWSADPFSSKPLSVFQTQIMRYVINNADLVVAAHTALISLIKKINKHKPVELIPNGVDTDLLSPKPRNGAIAESIGVGENDFVVAFSGHILEQKGLDVLVRSSAIVRQKHENVKYLIIGDGPAKEKVQVLVEQLHLRDLFKFTGYVPQESMAEYLSVADLCVAPYKPMPFFKVSLPETPLKVVEYMALGKPVLMSRISDENVISWSGGGLLLTPDDVYELAGTMMNLIENTKLRKEMGEKGRRYVEENLSWKRISRKLIEIYESINT